MILCHDGVELAVRCLSSHNVLCDNIWTIEMLDKSDNYFVLEEAVDDNVIFVTDASTVKFLQSQYNIFVDVRNNEDNIVYYNNVGLRYHDYK